MNLGQKDKLYKLIEKIIVEETILFESYQDDVIYQAFVQPFTDVIDTAKHGLRKLSTQVFRNGIKLARQSRALFIPFIGKSVAQITAEEEKKLQSKLSQIDKQYADVLKRNWDTLRTRDVSFLLFMMNPKLYLGSSIALKAPEAAFDILDSMIDNNTVHKWHNVFKELNKKTMPPVGSQSSGGSSGGMGASDYYYNDGPVGWESKRYNNSTLKENISKKELDKKASVTLQRLLADRNIQSQLENSDKIKEMRNSALDIFIEKMKEINSFDTIEKFKQFFGPEFNSVYSKIANKTEDKENLDKALIQELKLQSREMLVGYLKNLKEQAPGSEMEIDQTIGEIERML